MKNEGKKMGKKKEDRERKKRKVEERRGERYIRSRSNVMLSYDRGVGGRR